MIDTKHIKLLLDQVDLINNTYEKLAKATGENFNIFKILNLHTKEVRLHSALIAELLNPHGSHGLGNLLLNDFINLLHIKNFNFNTDEPVRVDIEKWLGYKTDTSGGYIDILLTDKFNNKIIIENKINAGDQKNQLLRYHDFDKRAIIVYLTLEGKKPTEFSTGNTLGILDNLNCISYSKDIIQWLEIGKQYAVNYPTIRETITQYILNLKHLTNQTMHKDQINDVVGLIIKSKEFIRSSELIVENWHTIQQEIVNGLKPYIKNIANKYNLECQIDDNLYNEEKGFWFYKENWKCCIYFYRPSKDHNNVEYGVAHRDINNSYSDDISNKLRIYLSDFKDNKYTDNDWFWVNSFTIWRETNWDEFLEIIPVEIDRITGELLDQLNNFDENVHSLS